MIDPTPTPSLEGQGLSFVRPLLNPAGLNLPYGDTQAPPPWQGDMPREEHGAIALTCFVYSVSIYPGCQRRFSRARSSVLYFFYFAPGDMKSFYSNICSLSFRKDHQDLFSQFAMLAWQSSGLVLPYTSCIGIGMGHQIKWFLHLGIVFRR